MQMATTRTQNFFLFRVKSLRKLPRAGLPPQVVRVTLVICSNQSCDCGARCSGLLGKGSYWRGATWSKAERTGGSLVDAAIVARAYLQFTAGMCTKRGLEAQALRKLTVARPSGALSSHASLRLLVVRVTPR